MSLYIYTELLRLGCGQIINEIYMNISQRRAELNLEQAEQSKANLWFTD